MVAVLEGTGKAVLFKLYQAYLLHRLRETSLFLAQACSRAEVGSTAAFPACRGQEREVKRERSRERSRERGQERERERGQERSRERGRERERVCVCVCVRARVCVCFVSVMAT